MTQTEADALAARLSVAGIACRLRGTDDVNALQMGGAGGKGVSIVVQAEQVEAAKELLQHDERLKSGGPWMCPRCDESNDATFEICWACGKSRGDQPDSPIASPAADSMTIQPDSFANVTESGDPYQPPLVQLDDPSMSNLLPLAWQAVRAMPWVLVLIFFFALIVSLFDSIYTAIF